MPIFYSGLSVGAKRPYGEAATPLGASPPPSRQKKMAAVASTHGHHHDDNDDDVERRSDSRRGPDSGRRMPQGEAGHATMRWDGHGSGSGENNLHLPLGSERSGGEGSAAAAAHVRSASSPRSARLMTPANGSPRGHSPCHEPHAISRSPMSTREWRGQHHPTLARVASAADTECFAIYRSGGHTENTENEVNGADAALMQQPHAQRAPPPSGSSLSLSLNPLRDPRRPGDRSARGTPTLSSPSSTTAAGHTPASQHTFSSSFFSTAPHPFQPTEAERAWLHHSHVDPAQTRTRVHRRSYSDVTGSGGGGPAVTWTGHAMMDRTGAREVTDGRWCGESRRASSGRGEAAHGHTTRPSLADDELSGNVGCVEAVGDVRAGGGAGVAVRTTAMVETPDTCHAPSAGPVSGAQSLAMTPTTDVTVTTGLGAVDWAEMPPTPQRTSDEDVGELGDSGVLLDTDQAPAASITGLEEHLTGTRAADGAAGLRRWKEHPLSEGGAGAAMVSRRPDPRRRGVRPFHVPAINHDTEHAAPSGAAEGDGDPVGRPRTYMTAPTLPDDDVCILECLCLDGAFDEDALLEVSAADLEQERQRQSAALMKPRLVDRSGSLARPAVGGSQTVGGRPRFAAAAAAAPLPAPTGAVRAEAESRHSLGQPPPPPPPPPAAARGAGGDVCSPSDYTSLAGVGTGGTGTAPAHALRLPLSHATPDTTGPLSVPTAHTMYAAGSLHHHQDGGGGSGGGPWPRMGLASPILGGPIVAPVRTTDTPASAPAPCTTTQGVSQTASRSGSASGPRRFASAFARGSFASPSRDTAGSGSQASTCMQAPHAPSYAPAPGGGAHVHHISIVDALIASGGSLGGLSSWPTNHGRESGYTCGEDAYDDDDVHLSITTSAAHSNHFGSGHGMSMARPSPEAGGAVPSATAQAVGEPAVCRAGTSTALSPPSSTFDASRLFAVGMEPIQSLRHTDTTPAPTLAKAEPRPAHVPLAGRAGAAVDAPASVGEGGPGLSGSAPAPASAPSLLDDPHNQTNFAMRALPELVRRMPRGKLVRGAGYCMRTWTMLMGQRRPERLAAQAGVGVGRSAEPPPPLPAGRLEGGAYTLANPPPPLSGRPLVRMTRAEVAARTAFNRLVGAEQQQQTRECLMVIRGVVYDVHPFLAFHPGGAEVMLDCEGKDATAVYDCFHAWINCESMLGPYAVGILDKDE